MIFNAMIGKEVDPIPRRALTDWNFYTKDISKDEIDKIKEWVNSKFDEVKQSKKRVTPSGWLASGFTWDDTDLYPIYRECKQKLNKATEQEIQNKSGQIYGLFVSLTLSERSETWYFVKDDEYVDREVPINSRIYFLPDYIKN